MRVLVYDDNLDFGGHQIMACHGVEALAADPAIDVTCMINPANRQLAKRWENFKVLDAPCTAQQLKSLNPNLLLCIQGDMTQSTQGIAAARKAGIECVSYLALPHTLKQMGAKLGALRDRIQQPLLSPPSRYVVISESMKSLLVKRRITRPITIVPNGIPHPKPKAQSPKPPPSPHTSCLTLGLLGRIEFNQKQQDFMVRTFLDFPEAFKGCRLLMAGDGPDTDQLRQMIEGKENITLRPWQDDTESFYNEIDFLMLPSRYEGVPLVMLEALARGIPVLGSNRDGMRDTLPEAWTFDPENGEALAYTFSGLRSRWKNEIEALQTRIITEASMENFKANFHQAVLPAKSNIP